MREICVNELKIVQPDAAIQAIDVPVTGCKIYTVLTASISENPRVDSVTQPAYLVYGRTAFLLDARAAVNSS